MDQLVTYVNSNSARPTVTSCTLEAPLTLCFNGQFPGGPELASTRMSPFCIFVGAKGDGGGGDNWRYKSAKLQ